MKTQFFDYRYYVPYNPSIQPPVGDYSLVVLARRNEQNNSSMENTDRLTMSYRRPVFKNKGESNDISKKIGEVSYLLHAHTITLTNDDGTTGTMRSDFTAQHSFSFNKKDNIDIMFTGQVEWKLKAPAEVASAEVASAEVASAEEASAEAAPVEEASAEAAPGEAAPVELSAKKEAVQVEILAAAAVPQGERTSTGLAAKPSIILTNPEKCIMTIGDVDTISAVSVLVNREKINHGNNIATLKNDGDYRVKGVKEYYKF